MADESSRSPSNDSGSSQIVLVGSFNPLILQPHWLAANEVLTEPEAEAIIEAGDIILTPDIAAGRYASFALEATRERVTFATTEETETPLLLRDLAVNAFSLLRHTPIRHLGMNHQRHMSLATGGWDKLRERLAPDAPWHGIAGKAELESITASAPRDDDLAGKLRITIEPSAKLPEGVWVGFNDHIDLSGKNDSDAANAEPAIAVLDEHFEPSLERSDSFFNTIRELA